MGEKRLYISVFFNKINFLIWSQDVFIFMLCTLNARMAKATEHRVKQFLLLLQTHAWEMSCHRKPVSAVQMAHCPEVTEDPSRGAQVARPNLLSKEQQGARVYRFPKGTGLMSNQ